MDELTAMRNAINACRFAAQELLNHTENQILTANPPPPLEFSMWAKARALEYRQSADHLEVVALRLRDQLIQREKEMG